jgi:aminoglycoside phosphotransferase (APT) family kinase protein
LPINHVAHPAGTPAAEVQIDAMLVAGLLADQHPDLAQLPLKIVDAGWDNALFRLGDQLAVRLPRRAAAAPLVVHEQRWLPHLAERLPLTVPAPSRTGAPGRGYPWHWSVVPWLPGSAADLHPPHPAQAAPFAAFLRSLHLAAPADAPANPVRGVALRERAAGVEERMRRLEATTSHITPQLRQLWEAAVRAPLDAPATWLHGDLHPRNMLVEEGVITGIIDWGDITSGDCATDLAAIWMLFSDPQARASALDAYGALSEATLLRARGWAILFGLVLLETGLADNPRNALIGAQTLSRVHT